MSQSYQYFNKNTLNTIHSYNNNNNNNNNVVNGGYLNSAYLDNKSIKNSTCLVLGGSDNSENSIYDPNNYNDIHDNIDLNQINNILGNIEYLDNM